MVFHRRRGFAVIPSCRGGEGQCVIGQKVLRGKLEEMEREEESVGFRKNIVAKLLNLHLGDDKVRVGGDALLLVAELLKVFVREAAVRAARQAHAEDLPVVDIEHVEKTLPQLLLDF
ncbi:centromere protein X [Discoglossus pictus]